MRCVDLFSGLGGFSQAFVDRGHEVIRYEYDERFKDIPHTTIKDIWYLTATDIRQSDIVLASPPCNHFSISSCYRHWPKGVPTKETLEQIDLIRHTIDLCNDSCSKYWILENPRGMLRKVIGKPNMTTYWGAWGAPFLKPTDLWGKFPPIAWKHKDCATWEKTPRGSKKGIQGILRDLAKRALIPYEFSLAVCLAAEGNSPQTTLEEYE